MAFLGGDSQSNGQLSSSINFNPVIQLGDDNTTTAKQSSTQTPTSTQKTEQTAAASLGFGGSGGAVGLTQQSTDAQPTQTKKTASSVSMPQIDTKMLGLGAMALGGFMLIKDKKKKKK